MTQEKIFALHPVQNEIISKTCFDCGEIIVGGIEDKNLGCMFACNKENCPHERDRAKEPIGEVNGKIVFVRALNDLEKK